MSEPIRVSIRRVTPDKAESIAKHILEFLAIPADQPIKELPQGVRIVDDYMDMIFDQVTFEFDDPDMALRFKLTFAGNV